MPFRINSMALAIAFACLVSVLIEASTPLTVPTAAARSRPMAKNILLIISDDMKPVLGSYGYDYASTPNIDRLAARGIRFSRAHCNIAECGPSRASFLTGYRPTSLNVYANETPLRSTIKGVLTLPAIFRFSGFRTYGMGKIGDGRVFGEMEFADDPVYPAYEEPTAFNQNATNCFDQPRPICKSAQGWSPKQCKCVVSPGVTSVVNEDRVPAIQRFNNLKPSDYIDERMGDFAAKRLSELLNDNETRPFVLIVGLTKPHLPFAAPFTYFNAFDNVDIPLATWRSPPKNLGNTLALKTVDEVNNGYTGIDSKINQNQKTLRRAQAACITFVDTQVGKILDAYDANTSPKRDETIIVFIADHGFHTGEQGHFGKWTLFESSTRVPFIIAPPAFPSKDLFASEWRAKYQVGRVVRTPVELLDLLPTLMDLTSLFDKNTAASQSRTLQSESKQRNGGRRLERQSGTRSLLSDDIDVVQRGLQTTNFPFDPSVRLNTLKVFEGKSLRKYLVNDVTPNLTALVMSNYNRGKFRGYGMRTERYRYVQWFPASGAVKNIAPAFEELYDYATDPGESTNIVSTSSSVRQQMRKLFVQVVSSGSVEFARTDESWLDANEDASMVNVKLPTSKPVPQLPYVSQWLAEVDAFFSPNNINYAGNSYYRVRSALTVSTPSATSIGLRPSVVQGLKLAIKDLVEALAERSGQGRLRRLMTSGFGAINSGVGSVPQEVVFTVDVADSSTAQFLANALKSNDAYFSYKLTEYLAGTSADANDPQVGAATQAFGSGTYPSVESLSSAPPTPASTPAITNAPVVASFTSNPSALPTSSQTPTRPGDTLSPANSSPPSTSPTADPTTSPIEDGSFSTPTPTKQLPSSTTTNLSGGAIAGISIGVIAAAATAGALIFFFGVASWRKKREFQQ